MCARMPERLEIFFNNNNHSEAEMKEGEGRGERGSRRKLKFEESRERETRGWQKERKERGTAISRK